MTTDDDWAEARPITWTQHHDPMRDRDRVTVDDFPEVTAVSSTFLERMARADPEYARMVRWSEDGTDTIRIEVDNGFCSYRVVAYDLARDQYLCRRAPAMGDAR